MVGSSERFSRANNILLLDKKRSADSLLNDVIKCDILSVLRCYFELENNACILSVDTLEDGKLSINMSVIATRGKDFWKV